MALDNVHESLVRRGVMSQIRNGIQTEHYGSASYVETIVGKTAFIGARAIEGLVSLIGLDTSLKTKDEISIDLAGSAYKQGIH